MVDSSQVAEDHTGLVIQERGLFPGPTSHEAPDRDFWQCLSGFSKVGTEKYGISRGNNGYSEAPRKTEGGIPMPPGEPEAGSEITKIRLSWSLSGL